MDVFLAKGVNSCSLALAKNYRNLMIWAWLRQSKEKVYVGIAWVNNLI